MTIYDVSVRKGRVRCSNSNKDEDYVTLEFEEEVSGINFLNIQMSLKDFGDLLSGYGGVKLKAEIRNVENLGKTFKHEPRSVVLPKEESQRIGALKYDRKDGAYRHYLETHCQEEGWKLDTYLGSRESIVHTGGGTMLNYRVYRWV